MRKPRFKKLPPLHPGEILREEFLVPLNLSAGALAKAMGVPRTRVERIAAETAGITADTALRLSKALGTSAELWLESADALRYQNRRARHRQGPRQDRARDRRRGVMSLVMPGLVPGIHDFWALR